MSFVKVGPAGGWAFGSKLTSAQMNQLDSDHANALDKSVAGDTLLGVVQMASTGAIQVNSAGAQIISSVLGGIESTTAKGIISTTSQGIFGQAAFSILGGVANAIAAGNAGAISDGGLTGGIAATVAKGVTTAVAGGIAPSSGGSIQDGGQAGGLSTTTPGGFVLGGGSTDWPTFPARTNGNTFRIPAPRVLTAGWSWSSFDCQCLLGPGTSQQLIIPLDFLHHGSTLAGLYIIFGVPNSHSAVPAQLPQMIVSRFPIGPGANASSAQSLYSGGFQTFGTAPASPSSPPGSGAAWYNSGNNQAFGFIPNQNNVIDTGNYQYTCKISDENGANSASGNYYYSIAMVYSNITTMQFP
jgi:hypothetical protein